METVFPTDEGFAGFFLVGFRKDPDPPGHTQRVGAVILKRTYDIHSADENPPNGTLTPAAEPLPVFVQDQPDMLEQIGNLVVNGDFETVDDLGNLTGWQPEATVVSMQVEDSEDDTNHFMQVTGEAGKQVAQTITLPETLAGHKFTLIFSAKADESTTVVAWLEASGQRICQISETLETDMKTFAAAGKWGNSVTATEMQVVLQTAADDGHKVFYDDVNVFSMVRYEHDLAPYKPDGDIIVLDFVDVFGQCSVKVDGQEWLRRTLGSNEFEMFGWASRSKDGSERASEAGTFSDDPNAYPPEWPVSNPLKDPLPPDFNNRFYNGYHREARNNAGWSERPHLTAAVPILIQRPGTDNNYGFRLGNEIVSARYYYYTGTGPDEERRWQSKDIDEIYFDTLVIEPDQNRCYAVWRGVWDFDERSEDAYRRLVVSVGEA